jgi:two-component system, cell cycle sensor histidine kinase and response regulator CckA
MNTSQTPHATRHPLLARFGRLQQALIEPPPSLADLGLRRTARLLAIFLLILIALFLLVDISRLLSTPGYRPPWYGYFLFGSAYALTRIGAHQAAAGLTIAAFPLIIFTTILIYPETRLQTIVHYLVLSVFLGSIFLSSRGLATLAITNIVGLLSLPLVLPTAIPSYAPLVTPVAVNTIGAAIALIFLRHRDQIERDRQAELHASAERLRLALDAAHMGMWDWDVLADVVIASEQTPLLFGLPAGTVTAPLATYLDRIHPADRSAIERDLAALLAGDQSEHRAVYRVLWPDGSVHWVEEQGRVHRDAHGRPVRVTGTLLDITLRKQAEAARAEAEGTLLASERRFRALIDNCADAVALVDRHGMVHYASPAASRMLGYELESYIGENAFAIIHPADRHRAAAQLDALVGRPGSQFTIELRAQHQDGSWHWFEATAVNSLADPAIAGIVVNFHDVTARKQAETAQHLSEERYRVISELVSDYAFAYQVGADGSTTLEWITDAFTRITGYTVEDIWTPEQLAAIIHPEDRPLASQRRRRQLAGQTHVSEYRIIAKDGRTLWQRFYDRPVWDAQEHRVVRLYGAVQDITQLKRLEQQLNQAQKMEAIGRLAGGIAHDFNNLLTVILGNAQLSLEAPADVQTLQENAAQIQDVAQRAATLTRQLLAFSRLQVLEPRVLNLNQLVENTGQLLRRLIGEDVELVMQLSPELWQVKADAGHIEQVIMNLVVNARDAMPMGGTLTITTANADLHDREVHSDLDVKCGSYVAMTIQDTGVGMDEAIRARIFEPFFTTKAPGKGTGLGLATVHGIVTQSGGSIQVDSAPREGSSFTIYLPRVDLAQEPSNADALPVQAPHGHHTILLVEDEPLVRELAGRGLRNYGYHILEAADGPTALQLSATYAGTIDVLLTDVVMPGGLSGCQVAEQMMAQRPAIKVLYISGYTDAAMTQQLVDHGQAIVLKPFTPDDLARAVSKHLQQ